MTVPPRRLLAHEVVRCTGEAVAAVVASSRVLTQSAAEAIEIDYEVRPSVVDPLEAIKLGAPQVWSDAPDNIVAAMSYGDAAKVEKAFVKSPATGQLSLLTWQICSDTLPANPKPEIFHAQISDRAGGACDAEPDKLRLQRHPGQ